MKPLLFAFCSLLLSSANAQTSFRQQQFNVSGNHLAIEGYDPVAYLTANKAVKGNPSLSIAYLGLVYHFSSESNRNLFRSNPAAYEPQYGGWCAYAMGSTGEKVNVDPETFKVSGGKLYLFYNKFFNNTLKSWNKDEAALHAKADLNWARLTQPHH